MKTKNRSISIWLLSITTGLMTIMTQTSAFASPITLGTPAYAGTGCPAGTAAAALSPDASQLSVLFDQFQVEAGGSTGKSFDRKSCNLAIPVHVPQGISISLIKVDYRGFNAIPQGGRSSFNVEYFFAGSRGPSYTKNFTGPTEDNYELSNSLIAQAIVWSPCGQDTILRTNANISAFTNSRFEQILSTVDSADISAGIVYQVQWKTCTR